MATLKSALVARFVSVAGGTPPLYFDEAPETADPGTVPYIVYLLIEAAPTLTTGDVTIQAIEAQFSAFGPSATAVEAIGATLRQAFDPARLRPRLAWDDGYEMTIAPLGGRTIRERRTTMLPDRGPGGAAVWHRLERFQVLVATTLAGGDAPMAPGDPGNVPLGAGIGDFDEVGFDDSLGGDDEIGSGSGLASGSTVPVDAAPPPAETMAGFDVGGFDDSLDVGDVAPAVAPAPTDATATPPVATSATGFDIGGFDDPTT